MNRILGCLLLITLLAGALPAAWAVPCPAVLENGETCGARLWRCNKCLTEGCDHRACPDTLQNPFEEARECRVCGSNDWSPLPEPEAAPDTPGAVIE